MKHAATTRRALFYATLLALFFFFPAIVKLYTDWLWFTELDLREIFSTILAAKIYVGGATALLVGFLLHLNALLFRRLSAQEPIMSSIKVGDTFKLIDIHREVRAKALWVIVPPSLALGFLVSSQWETVYLFLHQVPFGSSDPVFGRDIAYYIFTLPFLEFLFGLLFFVLFLSFIFAAGVYVIKGTLQIKKIVAAREGNDLFSAGADARTHLFTLIAVWFMLTAAKVYWVQIPQLVYSRTGPFTGASYTDIHATLPFLYILIVAALAGAALTIRSVRRAGFGGVVAAFALYVTVSFVGGTVYPGILQALVVKPNELAKETPYLERHIEATRKAWGLDKVVTRDLSGDSALSAQDIRDNEATIKNVRLWDRGPLLDTFGQLQEIRTYYDFVSVDNDRYSVNGEYRQVLLSPRELDSRSLPQRNFINERLTFTHGMGLTLSPVNEKTPQGLPELFVKDLPPVSASPELEITRPEIYYGERSNDYVFVNTDANEFNYPSGEENIYTTYEGTGGVPVDSLFKKLVFALRFNSAKIFFSQDITRESRVMYYRNIRERVRKIFPFLEFDGDPYMVIDNGRLVWLYDAYTVSNRYPYSESIERKNYMRNSVKIAIDAYNGSVAAYIADASDPVISSYAKVFPGVFQNLSDMPASLRAHIRYPEDIFSYQTVLYALYHMNRAQVFYNREDLWEIPRISGSTRGENLGPMMRRLIMKLPGEKEEEYVLMLPFTPRNKNNMSAWMAARSDGENYGELVVYRFPKQSLVFGPKQVVDRINQDAEISRQISLWDQGGSEVIQGNLFVIPINEALLYIRPLYLRAEGGKIPELKRVIAVYENRISMEETLEGALSKIFTEGSVRARKDSSPQTPASPNGDLIRRANDHYNRAQAALRAGDFSRYGEEMRLLGDVLRQLKSE